MDDIKERLSSQCAELMIRIKHLPHDDDIAPKAISYTMRQLIEIEAHLRHLNDDLMLMFGEPDWKEQIQ